MPTQTLNKHVRDTIYQHNNARPGAYRPEGKVMGATEEICERLERRLQL